jgi:radical SAM protein with 4Fe4S-binding SPASM domain
MKVKQKFIDPYIEIKSRTVDSVQYYKSSIPLPSVFEISPSGTCNRKCGFCPRSSPGFKDIKEFISINLIEKICNELAEINWSGLMLFSGFVEPLLNKNIYEIIAKVRNIIPKSQIELVTNGDVLSVDRARKLFLSGLDSFYISVYDGPERENELIKICEDAGLKEGQYKIRKRYLPESQDFGITLTNRGGTMEKAEYKIPSLKEPLNRPCYYPSYHFFTDYNGDVLICSHDWGKKFIVGNLKNEKFIDIWLNKKYLNQRKNLLENKREISPCKECDVIGTLLGKNHATAWKNN